jgi:hypothetical protein
MAGSKNIARLSLALFTALAVAASAAGCTTKTSSGDGGGGGGGGDSCDSYAGEHCKPGETRPCEEGDMPGDLTFGLTMTCELVDGEVCTTDWNEADCQTPLVLSFDGGPVEYLADREHGFDLNGGRSTVTDWPTARTPWLALDRDGNGRIDDGAELFGSLTVLSSGRRAPHGFAALRELDANGDGRLTPEDPGFARLLVWSDRDGDRRSAPGELAPASAWELLSIDLGYTSEPRCDARGNCEVERAAFRFRDAAGVERTGAIVDVHLAAQR